MTQTTTTPRVYVGTYRKYNEGSIFGEWLDLADFSSYDDFIDACKELHKDEEDPEFMFQDWEAGELYSNLIGESFINPIVWELMQALESASYPVEVYEAYAAAFSPDVDDPEQFISDAEDAYCGEYDSDEDFAESLADELGYLQDRPQWPYTCIDWGHAARELMYDYTESNGYYFRNI